MDADFWEEHKPRFLKIEEDPYPAIPVELKSLQQWVVWKRKFRHGKPTKVPLQVNGKAAATDDPTTWTDYQTVIAHQHRFDGIGVVFTANDPLCGVDIDDCLDAHRKLKPWAVPLVERLKHVSYGEISPSGSGIKFWTRAKLPDWINTGTNVNIADGKIEVYHNKRYFTVTSIGKGEIREGQPEIDWLLQKYIEPQRKQHQKARKARKSRKSIPQNNLKTANTVIQHIQHSQQRHKFDALMRGDITGYGSQSEADIALCAVIAF